MKGFGIGTLMVISAALAPVLQAYGVPRSTAMTAVFVTAFSGFIIQMYSAFSMRARHNREMENKARAHRLLMQEIRTMKPEAAWKRLMGGNS